MIKRFLQVQPTDLKFPFKLNKLCTCSIQLTNKTNRNVAFKVKTTHPKKYCVRPNVGIVSPGSTCVVKVSMQAQKEAPIGAFSRDKFLVQSIIAPVGMKLQDITSEAFRKEAGDVVEEHKLRVIFITADPPSPIPEAPEEESSPEASELENAEHQNSTKGLSNHAFGAAGQSEDKLSEVSRTSGKAEEKPLEIPKSAMECKDKMPEDRDVLSKLIEERSLLMQDNQKLHHELEMLRNQMSRGPYSRSTSIMFTLLIILVGFLLGYAIR